MNPHKLAILGAGNIRCSVPVIASLAGYFGERPLEIALYDADSERLDLLDRFARFAFVTAHAFHTVFAGTDSTEALRGADRAILQIDDNCAAKAMRLGPTADPDVLRQRVEKHLRQVLTVADPYTVVLSLQCPNIRVPMARYYHLNWPSEMTPSAWNYTPHQVLRWIRTEETIFDLLRTFERSPLKEWLEFPDSAAVVLQRDEPARNG